MAIRELKATELKEGMMLYFYGQPLETITKVIVSEDVVTIHTDGALYDIHEYDHDEDVEAA